MFLDGMFWGYVYQASIILPKTVSLYELYIFNLTILYSGKLFRYSNSKTKREYFTFLQPTYFLVFERSVTSQFTHL